MDQIDSKSVEKVGCEELLLIKIQCKWVLEELLHIKIRYKVFFRRATAHKDSM